MGKDLREEKGEERGENILGGKKEMISGGEKALGGKGGKDRKAKRSLRSQGERP